MRIDVTQPGGSSLPSALYVRPLISGFSVNSAVDSFPFEFGGGNVIARGRPFLIVVSGDAQNANASDWARLAIFRDSGSGPVQISNQMHIETPGANSNPTFCVQTIDVGAPGIEPGTQITYTAKIVTMSGSMWFGELDPPEMSIIEI